MKREIICVDCQKSLIGKIGDFPGEGHKFVRGKSHRGLLCDHCGEALPEGQDCYALSIFTDQNPYYEWENEFLR